MAELLGVSNPAIAAGQSSTQLFRVLLRLSQQEQVAMSQLCPPGAGTDLVAAFSNHEFLARSVSYAGGELRFDYVGGADTIRDLLGAICKQVVEETLARYGA